jgi:import inner membrane translocase subunit TIM21
MIKRPTEHEFEYKYLFLDVKGQPRIYLENTDAAPNNIGKGKTKLFGVQWTR